MGLGIYVDKKVSIIDTDGKLFVGTINDYLYPDENDLGIESIVLETTQGDLIEFVEDDIQTITII